MGNPRKICKTLNCSLQRFTQNPYYIETSIKETRIVKNYHKLHTTLENLVWDTFFYLLFIYLSLIFLFYLKLFSYNILDTCSLLYPIKKYGILHEFAYHVHRDHYIILILIYI